MVEQALKPAEETVDLGAEPADVLVYLASLANREGIDLGEALRAKDRVNETRSWR